MFFTGCVGMPVIPTGKTPVQAPPAPASDQRPTNEIPSSVATQPKKLTTTPTGKAAPQALAALTLIEQGRALLKGNKPDNAIRILERAMNLHPQNGKVYYYLAEAWLAKGNIQQAAEYNRLAELYFKSNTDWGSRTLKQKEVIQNR